MSGLRQAITCIHRERAAPSATPFTLCSQRPGFHKDPGLFVFSRTSASAPRRVCSLTSCRRTIERYWPIDLLPKSGGTRSMGASPLHFGCVHALRRRQLVCAARDVRGPGPAPCSEAPRPTGRSRVGTAEVESSFAVFVQRSGRRIFNPQRRVRVPHTAPAQEAFVELTLRRRKPAANIGRRRNPYPDGFLF
jgi:hypothetical protein